MVIREQNGQKQTYNVDLTSKEILNSPVYYLAQNDVVYVEPNNAKISSSKFTLCLDELFNVCRMSFENSPKYIKASSTLLSII